MEKEQESGLIEEKEARTHRRLDIRIKIETADRLKELAKRHDMTVTAVVKDLIIKYIRAHDEEKK